MLLRTRCSPPRARVFRRLVLAASVCAACLLGCSQSALKSMTCLSITDYEQMRKKDVKALKEHEGKLWAEIDREADDKLSALRQELAPISDDVADLKIRVARIEASRVWFDKLVTSLLGKAEPNDAEKIKAIESYLKILKETDGTPTTEE